MSDQFEVTLVWMNDEPMLPGRPYLLKLGTKTVSASVTALKHKINVNTLEHVPARELQLNEIAVGNISLDQPVAFDAYDHNQTLGGFILVDRLSHETVGAGLIHFALRRAQNIHWQAVDVTRGSRATLKQQKAAVLWFTGLSGAGKSTIANLVEKRLFAMGRHTTLLDGDNVRHGLNRDLGFTDTDRVENIRRVAEVARLMTDAGLIVLVSFISPFRSERKMARDLLPQGEFLEVFVDTPLDVAETRDVKGLYKKARRGEIPHFTGISSPYEAPEDAELHIDTTRVTPEQAAEQIVAALQARGLLRGDAA
jgi:bifunctional enzyme CysN/CysC